ncbi:MAG: ECF transporter S component [Ruminococcaceae bacterium]|nr:ECF transporter S component [Oscillospiraceae bacterium]
MRKTMCFVYTYISYHGTPCRIILYMYIQSRSEIPAYVRGLFIFGGFMDNQNKKQKFFDAKRLVGMAMFAALAYGVTFVFRIPVQFLTFDAKDAVLTIAAFIYGPASAIIMSLIPALIEFITISSTGFWGFLMNFASSACFSFTASVIYKYRRSFNGAIIGLYASVLATTALMMVLNILVTPIYMKVSREVVINLLPTLLLPFNFAKALMNAAITMLIYKPVSIAMKRAKLIQGKMDSKFNKQSVIMLIIGGVTLAAAVTIFIVLKLK